MLKKIKWNLSNDSNLKYLQAYMAEFKSKSSLCESNQNIFGILGGFA